MTAIDVKYKEEILLAELFRYLYPDFPGGKLIKSESPDFILSSGPKKKIGIEVTKLMDRDPDRERIHNAEAEEYKNLIILNTRDIFAFNYGLDVQASFLFKEKLLPEHSKIIPYSAMISEFIYSTIEGKNTQEVFHIYINKPKHLPFLNAISIFNHPSLPSYEWDFIDNYQLSLLNEEEISRKIQEKEEKLPIYRKKMLNQYWLLISTDINGKSIAVDAENLIQKMIIRSEFNRIFLLERIKGRLHELPVSNQQSD